MNMDLLKRLNEAVIEADFTARENKRLETTEKIGELMPVVEDYVKTQVKSFGDYDVSVKLLVDNWGDYSILAVEFNRNIISYNAINNIKEMMFAEYECDLYAKLNRICLYVRIYNK